MTDFNPIPKLTRDAILEARHRLKLRNVRPDRLELKSGTHFAQGLSQSLRGIADKGVFLFGLEINFTDQNAVSGFPKHAKYQVVAREREHIELEC